VTHDVVLIIDDVHLLEHPAAIDVLAVFKDLPGNGHLLLSGRIQPELATARVLRSLVEQATADQIVPEDETWWMLRRLGHAPPPATGSRPIHMSFDR
jgi:ATP/maltotriose-dependent transcriptional regulator MalT